MRTFLCVTTLALLAGAVCAQPPAAPVPICLATPQPIPSGVIDRPQVNYSDTGSHLDYLWMHSSTNLQGYAAKEKLASCLFYFPTDSDLKAQLGHCLLYTSRCV